jgi:hypothetical protein
MSFCKNGITAASAAAKSFSDFLAVYRRFRKDNSLGSPQSVHEICNSMSDKHGRICRYVKHAERNDPKKGFEAKMGGAFAGYMAYAIMVMDRYRVDIERGMETEMKKAVRQHARKTGVK